MGLDMTLYRKDKSEEIAYWRKQNAIHKWFVDNCNKGYDNNGSMPVKYKDLLRLREIVKLVLHDSKLVEGKVVNGYKIEKDEKTGGFKEIPQYEDGKVVEDSTTAKRLLPTQGGFFFGSLEYDQWYIDGLKYTLEVIEKEIEDQDNALVSAKYEYVASW